VLYFKAKNAPLPRKLAPSLHQCREGKGWKMEGRMEGFFIVFDEMDALCVSKY